MCVSGMCVTCGTVSVSLVSLNEVTASTIERKYTPLISTVQHV